MQEFIAFLQENWRFLTELILLVISLIIVLVKPSAKIKVPESVLALAVEHIPSLIQEAELNFGSGNGPTKKAYVLYKVMDFICDKAGISICQVPSMIKDVICDQVEAILSCPVRKKGDI